MIGHAGGRPVKLILEDEAEEVRRQLAAASAVREAQRERDRDDARKQALQARAQEGQMVGLARTNSLQVLAVGARLMQAARTLSDRAKQVLEAMAGEPMITKATCPSCQAEFPHEVDLPRMPPARMVGLVESIVRCGERINSQAHEAMRMERLHLGEPAQIIGIVDGREEMSFEEAEGRVRAAAAAIESARRAGFTGEDGGRALIGKPVEVSVAEGSNGQDPDALH